MALVPGYTYDIFISYAWVDNNPPPGIDLGWVDHFVDTLEIVLAQQTGRTGSIKISMDKRGESPRLTSKLIKKVQSSDFFLMIWSPGYSESDFCQKELNCFLEKLETKDQNLERIFVVEKTSHEELFPEILTEHIPIEFWYTDHNDRVRTWGWPKPEEREYYYKVEDVAYEVTSLLKQLKENPNGA